MLQAEGLIGPDPNREQVSTALSKFVARRPRRRPSCNAFQ